MSRKIRRVPKDWQHPRDEKGHYKPLYDQDYETAFTEWQEEKAEFESDDNAEERKRIVAEYDCHTFEDWHGSAPNRSHYRPAFASEPTHYQVYEDVSEGTPTSPVFASLEEMRAWLISEGFSEKAADRFAETGWAPSFVMVNGRMSGIGIHSLDML